MMYPHPPPSPDERHAASRRTALRVGVGVAAGVLLLPGCRPPDPADDGKLIILTSIAPLDGLVRPLLPEGAEVRTLVPVGASPHAHVLTAGDARLINTADLVVMVGMGLEGRVDQYLRERRPDRAVFMSELVDAGGSADAHLWLDPGLCEAFVLALPGRLAPILGEDAAVIAARAERHAAHIREVDAEVREMLAPFAGEAIAVAHDAWSRFTQRYGLRVAGVVRTDGVHEPTPGEFAEVVRAVREQGVGVVFTEPQIESGEARRLAQTAGIRLGTLDPLGGGDWSALMRNNAAEIVRQLTLARRARENADQPRQP